MRFALDRLIGYRKGLLASLVGERYPQARGTGHPTATALLLLLRRLEA